jgi:hypothetical protein
MGADPGSGVGAVRGRSRDAPGSLVPVRVPMRSARLTSQPYYADLMMTSSRVPLLSISVRVCLYVGVRIRAVAICAARYQVQVLSKRWARSWSVVSP